MAREGECGTMQAFAATVRTRSRRRRPRRIDETGCATSPTTREQATRNVHWASAALDGSAVNGLSLNGGIVRPYGFAS